MCNTPRYSESGKPCGVQRCEEYEALKQERDALLKVREAADAEITRLRRALDLLGVPAQALKDPDKAPPLHINVMLAKRAMEVVNND